MTHTMSGFGASHRPHTMSGFGASHRPHTINDTMNGFGASHRPHKLMTVLALTTGICANTREAGG
jgi:hypothetical protein